MTSPSTSSRLRPTCLLLAAALFGVLVTSGCATSTSTLQRAQTLAPGSFEVQGAMGVPISTALIDEAIESADAAADRIELADGENEAITEAEQRQALETSMALLLFTPAPTTQLALRYGVKEHLDVGLRYAGSLVKADGKLQLVDGDPGLDLSLNLGYAYHLGIGKSFASTAYDVVDYVGLGDYSRHDLDVGVIVGKDWGEWLSLYAAARYLVSFISLDSDIEKVETATDTPQTDLSSTMHYLGGSAGAMIGYRYVFFTAELNVMRVVFEPTILGEDIDLGGYVITPTVGLTGRF